ncbi:MAG TPA: tRNA pseudouridine(55) synthase TruB [Thermoguttaceae bacterium]|nr:tRNA pseudouridine(55) synthase TruB [Thermoguttaceae bacterium]
MSYFALLNLNKPPGMTSRDAINRVQRLLPRRTKIGHAGTLDPLASGVLVAAIGPATRLIDYIQAMPKSYSATFLLGRASPTEDTDGEVRELPNPPVPTEEDLLAAASRLVGRIEQRPPDFSALKIAGRRAYDLARAGQKVELAPRLIDVYSINVIAYNYPELRLDVSCGSGTYVRSLGRDLARSLGTEAVMSALTRTAIGDFTLAESVNPTTLNETTLDSHLLSPLRAVAALHRITLTDAEQTEIRHGRTIPYRSNADATPVGQAVPDNSSSTTELAATDMEGQLLAILIPRGQNRLGPAQNFTS